MCYVMLGAGWQTEHFLDTPISRSKLKFTLGFNPVSFPYRE